MPARPQVRCPKVPAAPTLWRLTSAGHVEHVASGACLVAKYTNSTQCPAQQLDPASAPICRSELWKIEVARRCADAPPALSLWKRNAETGHLELPKVGRCLAAVPPLLSNGVAIVATIQTTETNTGPATAADRGPAAPVPPQPSETATLHPMLECGIPALLTVGVASERDAGVPGVPAALSLARNLSMVSMAGTSRLRMATTAWWSEWWYSCRGTRPLHTHARARVCPPPHVHDSSMHDRHHTCIVRCPRRMPWPSRGLLANGLYPQIWCMLCVVVSFDIPMVFPGRRAGLNLDRGGRCYKTGTTR